MGCRDLAIDGTHMFGSYSRNVDAYDLDYEYVGSFTGCLHPNRLLACVPPENCFYTTGLAIDLYRMTWSGVWGSAAICRDLGPWFQGTAIAYDEILHALWMTRAGTADNLLRIPLGSGPVEAFTTLPEYEDAIGCTMAHTRFGYVLAVLFGGSQGTLVYHDLGYPLASVFPACGGGPMLELRARPSVLVAGTAEVDIARDGRDGRGRTQPGGVYLIQARVGSQLAEGRILILR